MKQYRLLHGDMHTPEPYLICWLWGLVEVELHYLGKSLAYNPNHSRTQVQKWSRRVSVFSQTMEDTAFGLYWPGLKSALRYKT